MLFFTAVNVTVNQGSLTWCPQPPGRPKGPRRSPAGLF